MNGVNRLATKGEKMLLTTDKTRKKLPTSEKKSSIVRHTITATDSRQKPQGFAVKAIVSCLSSDHRKILTTDAARIRSKSNRQLFVTRSPQETHDRSRKDSQQKQSLVVRHAITAKDSRQKPQGFAAKAIVGCLSSDHCSSRRRNVGRNFAIKDSRSADYEDFA